MNDETTRNASVDVSAVADTVTLPELRQREARYSEIFAAATEAMMIADMDGYLVEANPAACAMYGVGYEAMMRSGARVLEPQDIATIEATGTYRERAVHRRPDGTPIHVEGTAKRFTYAGKPHLLVVARDVSAEVEAYELLERRMDERTHELRTLLDVSQSVASTLELQPLLTLILDQLNLVVENDGSALLSLEGADLIVLARRAPGSITGSFPERYTVEGHELMWDNLSRGEPVIIGDVRGNSPLAASYARLLGEYQQGALSYERSFMVVPMMLKERIVGLLSVSSGREEFYTPHHAELAQAIAQHAAIAIDNARLYAQAQELATLEERQRLARELHDSVTQALFGINVAAHTARAQVQRDPMKALESIEYVRTLAQGGMAEMRALLFELRPESLENEGLVVAIRKHTQALVARHEVPITLELDGEPPTPLVVKEALYRITQEALNNIFKHARPTAVSVTLARDADMTVLEVADDGEGFDPSAEYPGHLGLRSMAERASRLGGTMSVDSEMGKGTRVRIAMPSRR